jgi:hypothetical protein
MERLCRTRERYWGWYVASRQDYIEPLIINFCDNTSSSDDSADSDRGNNGEDDDDYMEGLEPLH